MDWLRPIAHQLTVEKRVAVTLWSPSINIEFRPIVHLFEIGISTVCVMTQDVALAIVRVLKSQCVKVPKGNDLRDIINGLRDKWRFP